MEDLKKAVWAGPDDEKQSKKFKTMKLGDQALGNIMLALQKSILEQSDVTEVLRNFEFVLTEKGLWIKNPVLVKYDFAGDDEVAPEEGSLHDVQ